MGTGNMEFDNVQLDVEFSQASERDNITSNENIALSFGKLSTWFDALVPEGGSSGQILGWKSSGKAEWINSPVSIDEKVKVDKFVSTTQTDYLLTGAVASMATTAAHLVVDNADGVASARMRLQKGTTDTIGQSMLMLGNNIASGTSNNMQGMILMYSSSSKYGKIVSESLTDDRTWTLPDKTGTIAMTSDITPVNNGKLTIKGGTTSVAEFTANQSSDTNFSIIAGSNVTVTPDATKSKITIASSDTKVTSAANHYTPSRDTSADKTASASGATAAWSIDVVKGVTLQTDGKGHVTGLSVTSGKIPANPNTDTKVTSADNHYAPATVSGQDKSASASGATAAWSIDVVKGVTLNTDGKGHVTGISVTSGKIPANPVPSNNVTGSGTSGYLTKWNGANTITNGPQLGSSTTTFLRNDGTWATPANTDTKVTQSQTTTSNYRPILFGAKNSTDVSTLADTITDAAYTSTKMFAKPDTGNLYATEFITSSYLSGTGADLAPYGLYLKSQKQASLPAGGNYGYARYALRVHDGKTVDNNGMVLTMDSGGLTIVGSGESATALAALISDDQRDSNTSRTRLDVGGTLNTAYTGTNEQLILSSDSNIYLLTNCNTIADRKPVVLDTASRFYPGTTNTGSIGIASYQWDTIYGKTIIENGTSLASKYAAIGHAHGLLHSDLTQASTNGTTGGWSVIGIDPAVTGYVLKSIRVNQTSPNWLSGDFGAGIAFGGSDIKGVISMKYQSPVITFAGGNHSSSKTEPVWYLKISGISGSTYNLANFYDSATSRTANTVLAAPNGSNGGATFRKLVAADLPDSYLPLSGGTMTGNITFTPVTSTSYPASSKQLYWSGSTDWAKIYYRVDASDAGKLVFDIGDDTNTRIAFAYNGTAKSYIDTDGNFSGNAATATNANNVNTTVTNGSTSNVSYGVTYVADPNTSESNAVRKTNDFRIGLKNGTAGTGGSVELVLGNNKNTSTADNKEGCISLYSSNTSYHTLKVESTTSPVIHTFPATAGTVLNDGTTSFTQSLTSGTKIGTIKINGTSTDLYCQTNTNTDTKVTQSETTTATYRPIVFGTTNSTDASTLAATITGQTYVSTLLYAQPQNGILYANRMYLKSAGSKGQLNLLTSKYNVMLRNDDSNTYFLVTAQNDPTGTWTSARPLTINNSTGVCDINGNAATATTAANANVTVTNGSTTSTDYGIVFAVHPNTTEGNTLRKTNDFRYQMKDGAANTEGFATIVLGNNKKLSEANNKSGNIYLYSSGSNWHLINTTSTTSNITHTLPATSGTILNSGTTSFTQTLSSGTKIGTIKINGTSTDLYCQTNTNTTYSAGTGLSLSGTTFNHSNSVTAVTNYNKPYVKYDAQGHITGSSYWTATAAGTGGKGGWIKVATMAHTGNYDNTPLMLLVSQRGNTITYKLHMVWKNVDNKDPDIHEFLLSSDIDINADAYIKKSTTSTWELYIKKIDPYDAIAMHLYVGKYFPDHMTWTWQDVQTADSAITGGIEAEKIVPYNYYQSRTANTVLAAPNGSNGTASFRKLVAADIPSLNYSKVSISRNLTSGTKVGTITIDGTATDLYCQTNTNTDTKVKVTSSTSKAYLIGTTTSPDETAVEGVGNTGVYMTDGTLTASSIRGSGTENQSTVPTGGYRIYDCRSVNVSPNDGDKAANFYFHMTDMPNTSLWWSVLHMRGWNGAYTTWEIAGPSDSKDQRTTPLYVRTSNTNTAWGSWRKIYDTSNPPTASEVGALATTTKYAASSSVGGPALSVSTAGGDVVLGTPSSSSDDSGDIYWKYGNGQEKARLWQDNTYTAKAGPTYRIYKSDGTALYNGRLPLADGTSASGTWGISITGNAATATTATKVANTGVTSAWWNDRDNAVIRLTKADSNYRPLWSLLTSTTGSWAVGNHNNDNLVFNFISKATYDSGSNPASNAYKQVIFTNEGGITTTGAITASGTGTFKTADFGTQLIVERSGNPYFAALGFKNSLGMLGYIGANAVDSNLYHIYASDTSKQYIILDTGNTSVTTSGSGNAITALSFSNGTFTATKGSTFSLSTHTHNYAGSSSAGGPATYVALPRVTADAKSFPGANKVEFKEYSNTSTNTPSSAWYHIISMEGSDSKYGTQLALGMTTNGVYYRNYNNQEWLDWQPIGRFTATPTSDQVVITNGTIGGIKSSGYTIAKSVPSNAVFTDANVTQTPTDSSYTNYCPLLIGASGSSSPGFTPTLGTAGTYVAAGIYCQPSSGKIYATELVTNTYPSESGSALCHYGLYLKSYKKASLPAGGDYSYSRYAIRGYDGKSGDSSGMVLTVDSGGLTIVGSGESAVALANLISDDQRDANTSRTRLNVGGTLNTAYHGSSEQLILSSDNNIYFLTACNTITGRKPVCLDTSSYFYPGTNNTGSIGTTSYYWASAYIGNIHGTNIYAGKASSATGALTLYNSGSSGSTTLKATSQTTDGTYLLPACGNGTYTLSIGMMQVGGTGDSLVMSNVSGIPAGTLSFKIVFKSNATSPMYSMVEIPNIGDGIDCGGLIQIGDYSDGTQGSPRIVMKGVVIRVTAGRTTGTKTFTATVTPTQKISGSSVSEYTRNVIMYKIYACT